MLESDFTPKINKNNLVLITVALARHELASDAYLSLKAAYR